jgi:hypothetical protein
MHLPSVDQQLLPAFSNTERHCDNPTISNFKSSKLYNIQDTNSALTARKHSLPVMTLKPCLINFWTIKSFKTIVTLSIGCGLSPPSRLLHVCRTLPDTVEIKSV